MSKAEGEKCPRCWHYTQDVGKVAERAEICRPLCRQQRRRWRGERKFA
ncbi:zinc finger domain-containing protein [Escherichia coli]